MFEFSFNKTVFANFLFYELQTEFLDSEFMSTRHHVLEKKHNFF